MKNIFVSIMVVLCAACILAAVSCMSHNYTGAALANLMLGGACIFIARAIEE